MRLEANWFYENEMDFEYLKYRLLAYQQSVEKSFDELTLFPHFEELNQHLKNSSNLIESIKQTTTQFPKELIGINGGILEYKSKFQPSFEVMQLMKILMYSRDLFEGTQQLGKQVYDYFKSAIYTERLGLETTDKKSGYLLMRSQNSLSVYNYIFSPLIDGFKSLKPIKQLNFTSSFKAQYHYKKIRDEVIKENPSFSLPSFYVFETEIGIPFEETYLPIGAGILKERYLVSS